MAKREDTVSEWPQPSTIRYPSEPRDCLTGCFASPDTTVCVWGGVHIHARGKRVQWLVLKFNSASRVDHVHKDEE